MKRLTVLLFLLPWPLLAEIPTRETLFETARYLYRWYLDESHVEKMIQNDEVVFYVRDIPLELDDGDQSEAVEIIIGGTEFGADLKKSDYFIQELNLAVKDENYKIFSVFRTEATPADIDSYQVLRYPYREVVDHLFKTRSEKVYPDEYILGHLRKAVGGKIREVAGHKEIELGEHPEIIHFSSLSPVSDDIWFLWERANLLIHYASEFDLHTEEAWQHADMATTLYDLDEQVVVSLHEVPGSNAYMTRDMAGRALFNCLILGKRIEVIPVE